MEKQHSQGENQEAYWDGMFDPKPPQLTQPQIRQQIKAAGFVGDCPWINAPGTRPDNTDFQILKVIREDAGLPPIQPQKPSFIDCPNNTRKNRRPNGLG